MKKGILVYFVLSLCFHVYAGSVSAQKTIENFLVSKKYTGKGIGIVIQNLENDSIYVKINESESMNPASVAKLVTASAAFELLGTGYYFTTKVYISGGFDRDSGIVKGDLYIKGGADPGFSAERLWLLVQHLYHQGIRRINGNLILDESFFDSVTVGPGFDEDSNSRAYQPLISPLSVSFNTLAIHARAGNSAGSPVFIDVFPKIHGVTIQSSARTAEAGKGNTLDVQTTYSANHTNVIVKGSVPIGEQPRYIYRKVWQTWETFGGAIISAFDETGISLAGSVKKGDVPKIVCASMPFYEFVSEPLSVYVNHMFKYSSNFASEMLFKTIPAVCDSSKGSWVLGSKRLLDWWQKNKLPGEPVIRNGSGMGNTNRYSAIQLTALLSHVWKKKEYLPEYLNALSVSGIDGTLKSRFKKSPLKGIVRAKTGTLNSYGVSTLAGYLLLPKSTYAFTILCNKVGDGQYDNWVTQEQILEKFYNQLKQN